MAQPLSDIEEGRAAADSSESEENNTEQTPLPALADDTEETRRPLVSRQRTIRELSGHILHREHLQALRMDWFCSGVFIGLLFCVAVGSIIGMYVTETLQLGPNSSILINANHFFVDSIEVVEVDEANGLMMYGFYKNPPLDVLVSWSEIHKTSLPISTHKEWMYYLNEGSQVNISYSMKSSRALRKKHLFGSRMQNSHDNGSNSNKRHGRMTGKHKHHKTSLLYALKRIMTPKYREAAGQEEFANWLEDPSYSSANLSWKTIQGNGTIQKAVLESSAYYVPVCNLHTESVEVLLNIRIKAFIFNTTEPYYKCIPAKGQCSFKLFFLGGNVAVLTFPIRQLGIIGAGSNVKISYGPRWITYLVGVGGISALVLVITYFLNHIQRAKQETRGVQAGGLESERNPLLLNRDDDDAQAEAVENVQDPCTICQSGAPIECVFHPCGHVACSICATRLVREFGTCPICRGPISEETIQTLNN